MAINWGPVQSKQLSEIVSALTALNVLSYSRKLKLKEFATSRHVLNKLDKIVSERSRTLMF